MDLNLSVFQEPRGVMRIFQFIFSICAFATISGYEGFIDFACKTNYKYTYDYPFNLFLQKEMNTVSEDCRPRVTISGDFSSDATFFVSTGVLSMLYTIAVVILYTKFDELYKNTKIPLIDFSLTVVFAILWLASSAAWANGLAGLKHVTDANNIQWDNVNTTSCPTCPVQIGSFTTLNISVIFGFLNFILWAADLWFLYKETIWFQRPQNVSADEI